MRALNTLRRPIVNESDSVTSGLGAPLTNLGAILVRQSDNQSADSVQCISGEAHIAVACPTSVEIVTLEDGTQITFGTIDLLANMEIA